MGLSVGRAVGWVGRVEKAQTTTYGAPVGVTVFRFNSVRYRGGSEGGTQGPFARNLSAEFVEIVVSDNADHVKRPQFIFLS